MHRNQRFLIALSNTEHDPPLIRYARQLAESGIGREFQFLHVPADASRTDPDMVRQDIDQAVALHFGEPAGVLQRNAVQTGVRVDTLLDFATRQRSDVILLGHRRRSSGQRSLARRLAMFAPCSVWMVPEGAPTTISRIVVPVDFSEHSADSLGVATSLARMLDIAEVYALHVAYDPSIIRYDEHVEEFIHDEMERFRVLLEGVDTAGVNVICQVREGGTPARTTLQYAADHRADLLIMNTRGRSRAAAVLLGSVATQVMVEARVAVLTVKHFGAMLGLFQVLRDSHLWRGGNPKTN